MTRWKALRICFTYSLPVRSTCCCLIRSRWAFGSIRNCRTFTLWSNHATMPARHSPFFKGFSGASRSEVRLHIPRAWKISFSSSLNFWFRVLCLPRNSQQTKTPQWATSKTRPPTRKHHISLSLQPSPPRISKEPYTQSIHNVKTITMTYLPTNSFQNQ